MREAPAAALSDSAAAGAPTSGGRLHPIFLSFFYAQVNQFCEGRKLIDYQPGF